VFHIPKGIREVHGGKSVSREKEKGNEAYLVSSSRRGEQLNKNGRTAGEEGQWDSTRGEATHSNQG